MVASEEASLSEFTTPSVNHQIKDTEEATVIELRERGNYQFLSFVNI